MKTNRSHTMKLLLKTLIVGAGLSASSLFALPTVFVTRTGFDGIPDAMGGEFVAHSSANGTFLTFCLEHSVGVVPGEVYEYTIDDVVLAGGVAGPLGDPISNGTAWLYKSFLDGTLADSDGVGLYAENHDLNAGLLQNAIWSLEGALPWDVTNYYLTIVGPMGTAMADYAGSDIKAMNLWTVGSEATGDVQSMIVRVPDGATTSVLLGLGLISLAFIRRKL